MNTEKQLPQLGQNSIHKDYYANNQIECDIDHFGEWFVSDEGVLNNAKALAIKLMKNNKWTAKRAARKVAEKLKLRKYAGPTYIDPADKYNEPVKPVL